MPPTLDNDRGNIRRRQIVDYIQEFKRAHGYAPTIREITEDVYGNSGFAATQKHIETLKDQGYVDYDVGRSRTLRVIRELPKEDSE